MKQYIQFLKSKLESLQKIQSVTIENDSELHFVAFGSDIIVKVNPNTETYNYTSGGTAEQRSAIDEVLRTS